MGSVSQFHTVLPHNKSDYVSGATGQLGPNAMHAGEVSTTLGSALVGCVGRTKLTDPAPLSLVRHAQTVVGKSAKHLVRYHDEPWLKPHAAWKDKCACLRRATYQALAA